MRTIVFAYHNIGHSCLSELLALGEDVVGVVTHRDDPGEEMWFRSVGALAERHGIACFHPDDPNEASFVETVRALAPDVLFSFYYRKLLGEPLLAIPRRGALNLHGSLLPRYRGRCPANWVILHGETESGVTLHHMTRKPDAGDIVGQEAVSISPRETAFTLMNKLEKAAATLVRRTVPLLRAGTAPRIPQDPTRATTFGGRRPEDGRIDWTKTATEVDRLVRAVTHPYPGAFSTLNGRKLFVWESLPAASAHLASPPGAWTRSGVVTGEGLLEIVRCQLDGEPEMDGAGLARAGLREGEILGAGVVSTWER